MTEFVIGPMDGPASTVAVDFVDSGFQRWAIFSDLLIVLDTDPRVHETPDAARLAATRQRIQCRGELDDGH